MFYNSISAWYCLFYFR